MTSAPSAIPAAHRIAVLDGLRGLAIALVVVYHLHQDVPRLWPGVSAFGETGVFAHLLDFFLLGVDLFYVLSGFFIGAAVLKPAVWAPWVFLKNRLTRILPAYYLSLLLTLLWVHPQHVQTLQGWLDVGLHLLMLHSFQEWTLFSINGAYWTLGIEFSFYGLMLVMAPFWRARWGWRLPLVFVSVCLLWRAGVWVAIPVEKRYFWCAQLPGALDEFALGMGLALLYRAGWVDRVSAATRWGGAVAAVCGAGLVGACLTYYVTLSGNYWESGFALVFSRSFLGLGFALLVLSFLMLQRFPRFEKAVQASPFAHWGEISYSVYLYHTPVIFVCFTYGQAWLSPVPLLGVSCVMIWLVSAASFRWVERYWHPSL